MSKTKPWLTQPFIATSEEQIMEAAQSKYIISSVNEILPEIGAFKGRLAYVGLPGQVQSIRALQKENHPWVQNIDYIFGPFYGNTLHFSSIKSFLRSYGEKDYKKIQKLYFRHGEWPGNMRVELNDGKVFQLKKFHANYLIPFHIVKNSLSSPTFRAAMLGHLFMRSGAKATPCSWHAPQKENNLCKQWLPKAG
jgi:coenzyme F420 hydrogenase subunit beta